MKGLDITKPFIFFYYYTYNGGRVSKDILPAPVNTILTLS